MTTLALYLFGLLPVISFILLYFLSRMNNRWQILKNNYAILYLDWTFIPFNLFIPLSVIFSWKIFIAVFVLALIVSIIINRKWHVSNPKNNMPRFFTTDKGLTPEGWIHLLFMSVQGALVITVLFSRAISFYYIIELLILFMYFIPYILIVMFVRKLRLRNKSEMPFVILGIITVIIRMMIYFS
jgi:hypothetical protein